MASADCVEAPVAVQSSDGACPAHAGLFMRTYGRLSGLPWLVFLGFPLASLLGSQVSRLHLALTLLGFALCLALYFALLLDRRPWLSRAAARGAVLAMFGLGVALTGYDRPGWAGVIVYCAAAMSFRRLFTERVAIALLAACTVTAAALAVVRGASFETAISVAVSCIGVGLLLIVIGELRARNGELVRAREDLARLAVAEERLRFARDIHDLLGHSLSVVALKAELVGRLLERDLDAASVHIEELQTVARGALAEVRQAVSGYRRPVLSAELEGARMALEDAGIQARIVAPERGLSPDVEALLAWTVREGATNVIRHSDARSCDLVIACDGGVATAEVTDDGGGSRLPPPARRAASEAAAPVARRAAPSGAVARRAAPSDAV
ncbi:MAG: sensor histidine kinase, partial [Solirubrobacteraceae bacterium]